MMTRRLRGQRDPNGTIKLEILEVYDLAEYAHQQLMLPPPPGPAKQFFSAFFRSLVFGVMVISVGTVVAAFVVSILHAMGVL